MAYHSSMRTLHALLVAAALLAGGCVTVYDEETERQNALLQRQQAQAQQERFDRLNGRLESLQMEVDALRRDLDRQRADQGRAGSAEMQALRESVTDLDRRLAAESAARERDRKAILDSVSSTVSSLLRSSGGSRSSSSSSTTRRPTSGQGVIHKVEAGQTLSAIAAAYKVSSSVIMEANGMKNPNQLRVGQELIIPTP